MGLAAHGWPQAPNLIDVCATNPGPDDFGRPFQPGRRPRRPFFSLRLPTRRAPGAPISSALRGPNPRLEKTVSGYEGPFMTARKWLVFISCVVGPLAVGYLSGMSTADSVRTWYVGLAKPSFNPPSWVFGPVWTLLYLSMGGAAFLVWNSGTDRRIVRLGLLWFGAQLIANGLWSLLFFGLRNPGIAFLEILLLLAMIVLTTRLFWSQSRAAGLLMLPYIAWVGFAAILNFSIWRLNA